MKQKLTFRRRNKKSKKRMPKVKKIIRRKTVKKHRRVTKRRGGGNKFPGPPRPPDDNNDNDDNDDDDDADRNVRPRVMTPLEQCELQLENVRQYLTAIDELCTSIIEQGTCCICSRFNSTTEMARCTTCKAAPTCLGCADQYNKTSFRGDLGRLTCAVCKSAMSERTSEDLQELRDKITRLEATRVRYLRAANENTRDAVDHRASIDVLDNLLATSEADLTRIGQHPQDINSIIRKYEIMRDSRVGLARTADRSARNYAASAQRTGEDVDKLKADLQPHEMPQEITLEYVNEKHSQLIRLIEMLLRRIERRRAEIQEGTGNEEAYLNTYRVMSDLITKTYDSLLDDLDDWFPDQCGVQTRALKSPTKVGLPSMPPPSLEERLQARQAAAAAAAAAAAELEDDEEDDDDE